MSTDSRVYIFNILSIYVLIIWKLNKILGDYTNTHSSALLIIRKFNKIPGDYANIHSSAFNVPINIAIIRRLSYLVGNNFSTKESDFTSLMFSILSYYTDPQYLILSPEAWNDNRFNRKGRCDGLVSAINLDPSAPLPEYGSRIPRIMYEAKKHAGTGWEKLMKEQAWEQADSVKNENGRIWVIIQRGFELCVFKFDILRFNGRGDFTNFKPLNLNGFSESDLIELDAQPLVKVVNNNRYIQVIRWKLNDDTHHRYIHEMLSYIYRTNVDNDNSV